MDYWPHLDVTTYLDFDDFLAKNPGAKIYMATTKARQVYTDVHYEPDCYIMFGKESAASRRKSSWKIRSGPCGFP